MDAKEKKRLQAKARELRRKLMHVTFACGGSHLGGSMSQMEVLVALYYKHLKIDPKNPALPDRDRFILSKGHGGVGHATILGDLGFFDEKLLLSFNKTGSPFGMHLDKNKVPGVDASTGSLGHGLPIAVGMALGARLNGFGWHTFCVVSDGECDEGSTWEAAMAAAHHRVGNLTAIVDRNMFSLDGPTSEVMALEPFADKWRAFNWIVEEIDGHDFAAIDAALTKAREPRDKPLVIIARTVKGKGVSFMENSAAWHYAGLDAETRDKALAELA